MLINLTKVPEVSTGPSSPFCEQFRTASLRPWKNDLCRGQWLGHQGGRRMVFVECVFVQWGLFLGEGEKQRGGGPASGSELPAYLLILILRPGKDKAPFIYESLSVHAVAIEERK